MSIPATKIARQARIVELVGSGSVHSQAELAQLLARDDLQVTQATLSRDLVEVGAVRVRDASGSLVYTVPSDAGEPAGAAEAPASPEARLAGVCRELLVTAEASANLVMLKTPPGAAQYFASIIDQSGIRPVLGTIAGDDSIMVISRDPSGGEELAEHFLRLAGGE